MSLWYKMKSSTISWFADIRVYNCGFILWGDSHYKVKGPEMRAVLDNIEPGDVLLRRYSHYIGSVLVPGHFSHAAFYAGDNKIIHMLGEGVSEEDILTFMRCDDILILRPPKEAIQPAIEKAKRYLAAGVDYDYDFDTDSEKKFYCTEFVDNLFGYPVRESIGEKKIMPDNFLDVDFFSIKWRR